MTTTTPPGPAEPPAPPGPSDGGRRPRRAARVVVVGGGPGGYEAALVAARAGADVTLAERHGLGGAAVLTDVVPSKTLIATAEWMTIAARAPELGIRSVGDRDQPGPFAADLARVNARVRELAEAQSADIRARLEAEGVRVVEGTARLDGPGRVVVARPAGGEHAFDADAVLLATGATPRVLPDAVPDGERVLDWTQVYGLTTLPERLVVVGSGVTGVEFAGAYGALGCDVVLVSSRDQILPSEDPDAAAVVEEVFRQRGMTVLSRSRAAAVRPTGDGVVVTLTDGRTVEGSHCLLAVGSVPSTGGMGLAEAGVALTESGHVEVDRVSRTTAPGVYAAGDCAGVLPLASVAAMQGRIAMEHALGQAVTPLDLRTVAANVFTAPEIASVGASQRSLDEAGTPYVTSRLELARNPRAKMLGMRDGFVKLFAHASTGTVLGGVVVAPRAGELIFPVTLAVAQRLTADDVAHAFTVYPSLSGSIAEVARLLPVRPD
ncbi:MAG: NAD(P)H-quinone dehydrogenase [Actinomycetales bacterium]|nr:NAD(P)H-quinone dehydrogenase [Actinomycetales bacterium]